jgi:hypothetical protein
MTNDELKKKVDCLEAMGGNGKLDSKLVEEHLSPAAQYACMYWVLHFHFSGIVGDCCPTVHQFLETNFDKWIIALIYIEGGNLVNDVLRDAEKVWVRCRECNARYKRSLDQGSVVVDSPEFGELISTTKLPGGI